MDSLKTAVVVVLLLAVLYGVYVVMSKPDAPLSQEIAWHEQKASEPLQIDMGSPSGPTDGPSKPGIRAELTADPKVGQPAVPTFSTGFDTPQTQIPAMPELPSGSNLAPNTVPSNAFPTEKKTSDVLPANGSQFSSQPPQVAAPTLLPSGPPEKPSADAGNLPSSFGRDNQPLSPLREIAKTDDSSTESGGGIPQTGDLAGSPSQGSKFGEGSNPSFVAGAGGNAGPVNPFPNEDPAVNSKPSEKSFVPANDDIAPRRSSFPSNSDTYSGGTSTPSAPSLQPSSPGTTPDLPGDAAKASTRNVYSAALSEAHGRLDRGEWYQALVVLSKFYQSPNLTGEQHKELLDLLDPLAGKVIYSAEHLMENPHEVQRGETWASIAEKYQVPWELLYNINGGQSTELIIPGTKLKVVRGPFRAEVDLKSRELTLFAGQLYAGRFPISTGRDPAPKPGEYRVQEKSTGRVYYAGDGRTIAAEDPNNPFGRVWIGLGSELSIHGSPVSGSAANLGCISLSPLDAQDVYNILSPNSSVLVR